MNVFLIAAAIMLAGLVPCGIVCVRASAIEGVVALELAGSLMVTVLICLAEGYHRSSFFDLPVICALVAWINGLVFARFMGRLLR